MHLWSRTTALSLTALALGMTVWCLVRTPLWASTSIVLAEAFGWCWWLERQNPQQ